MVQLQKSLDIGGETVNISPWKRAYSRSVAETELFEAIADLITVQAGQHRPVCDPAWSLRRPTRPSSRRSQVPRTLGRRYRVTNDVDHVPNVERLAEGAKRAGKDRLIESF